MNILLPETLPYCKGCGHHYITSSTARALETLGFLPLDVTLVTDIGCHGIADECFATHTVHGLHGRSIALAAGIAMNAPSTTKVIVFIGDGGVTIGLQHLMEAIRLNIPMTVVVHNNFLYGMTGGQTSGLTPCGYRTTIAPEGNEASGYDICSLARAAGAPDVRRIVGRGDISAPLAEAFATKGFSLVEVVELCPSYGAKLNRGVKPEDLAGETGVWRRERGKVFNLRRRESTTSLVDDVPEIPVRCRGAIDRPVSIVIGGSAGEGVQSAAELFAQGAMAAGLHVTKKGSYPVTVGVGFSSAEVIVSPSPILFHGIAAPDALIVTSQDGLEYHRARAASLKKGGLLLIDASLSPPAVEAEVIREDFRGPAGPKNAVTRALRRWLERTRIFPLEAFPERVGRIPSA